MRKTLHDRFIIVLLMQASFLDVRKKTQGGKTQNSRNKLKTQAKNSENRHFPLKKTRFLYFLMTYSPVKILNS